MATLKPTFPGKQLSRAELKKITGGYEDPPSNTWGCDCGPGTTMSVYGTTIEEVLNNYLSVAGPNCTWDEVTCFRY